MKASGIPGFVLPFALLLGANAAAQEPVPATEPPAEQTIAVEPLKPAEESLAKAETPQQLDEVVVTATKREANPRDLPGTVNALRGEDLEQRGYQSQEDFLKLVPGVTFANDNITPNRITIRGIGADLNTSNTTGVFIGDVPFEDPTLPRVTLDPNPFDLARIEVLKGPQGTLFGGSALNGAVRYVPQDPLLETWEAKTYLQMERVSEGGVGLGYGAALNIPAGDTLAFRLVGFDRSAPGWVDNDTRSNRKQDVNELEQSGGRLMALWQPDDRWKISAMGIAQDSFSPDIAITDNREGELSRSNTPQSSPIRSRYDLETLGVQYRFDSFDLLSQTSRTYKRFYALADASRIANLGPNPPPTVTLRNDNESDSFMQELRLSSNEGFDADWNWLGGAFYRRVTMRESSDILASNLSLPLPPAVLQGLVRVLPGIVGIITEDGKINTARGAADPVIVTESALFGETTATFWEDLEVTLGLRAFRTVSDSRVVFSGALTLNQALEQGGTQFIREGTLREQGINPKLALKYRFDENVALYTAVTRGFRFGGPQVLIGTLTSNAPDSYKSDTLWNYELGLRTDWLDRTLAFDVTGFQIDWIDPQLQQADTTGLGSFFDNVGGARSRGVEWALRYLTPVPGLALALSGAWVDTVTTKPFTTSDGTDTQPGTRWPLAAEWQSATTLLYNTTFGESWTGGATVVYSTISSAPNTLSYLDTVFGYETLDVTLSLGNPGMTGRPEFSLSLNNAMDERGLLSGVNNPQFAKDHVYIKPRTLVARLSLAF